MPLLPQGGTTEIPVKNTFVHIPDDSGDDSARAHSAPDVQHGIERIEVLPPPGLDQSTCCVTADIFDIGEYMVNAEVQTEIATKKSGPQGQHDDSSAAAVDNDDGKDTNRKEVRFGILAAKALKQSRHIVAMMHGMRGRLEECVETYRPTASAISEPPDD